MDTMITEERRLGLPPPNRNRLSPPPLVTLPRAPARFERPKAAPSPLRFTREMKSDERTDGRNTNHR
jgi:hypothetical protein